MKQRGSNLVTKAGIVILALILLAAAYFRMDALLALSVGLLIVSVIAYLWTYISLSHVTFSAADPYAEGFPGEELTVHASLRNDKALPVIWLRLSLPQAQGPAAEGASGAAAAGSVSVAEESAAVTPAGSASGTASAAGAAGMGICVRTPEEDGVIRSFLWLMPHQSVSWEMKLRAARRGVLTTDHFGMTGGDGFGLAEQERVLQLKYPLSFVVFPQSVPVNTAPIRSRVQHLELSRRGIVEDVTLLRNVRDYQYGDPARRINRRQAARTGALYTNIYEQQEMRHAALALDTESFVRIEAVVKDGQTHYYRRTMEEPFEAAVSLAASAALDLLEHGICCTLILDGERTAADAASDGRRILRMLAGADPAAYKAPLPGEELFSHRHQDGPMFLLTRTADVRILAWLDEWRDLGANVICMETEAAEDAAGAGDPAGAAFADPAVMKAEEVRG